MYAILKQDNSIGDFEKRQLPLHDLVHPDFHYLYIEVPEDTTLKIGDIYDRNSNSWEILEVKEEEPEEELVEPIVEPRQPSNAELAQMISDLQADLIIAGVI